MSPARIRVHQERTRYEQDSTHRKILHAAAAEIATSFANCAHIISASTLGKNKFNVPELARKIKHDGLLDPLIVNQIGNDHLVFEGNRRLAALTLVYQDFMNNNNGIIPERFQKNMYLLSHFHS